jgi:diguanylate cyclase (GGDEF)-like protein
VLELAAERALEALGCASLSAGRREPGWIVTLVNVGRLGPGEERLPSDERYPMDDYPTTARDLASGGMTIAAVDDPDTDPAHRELLHRVEKESSVTVPIVIEGSTWGELWATSEIGQPRLTERDGMFLRAIADQIAAAIGRAELFAKVEALAYTDPLTGLANRRVLEHELERSCDEPAGPGSPSLLLCDIDGLKAVNDEAGHEAGDGVIVQVAMTLSEAAGAHADAVVSRMGGDEFCVLLPSADAGAARAVAEDAASRLGGEGAVTVGISCGVAGRGEGVNRPARGRRGPVPREARRAWGVRVGGGAGPGKRVGPPRAEPRLPGPLRLGQPRAGRGAARHGRHGGRHAARGAARPAAPAPRRGGAEALGSRVTTRPSPLSRPSRSTRSRHGGARSGAAAAAAPP